MDIMMKYFCRLHKANVLIKISDPDPYYTLTLLKRSVFTKNFNTLFNNEKFL